MLVVELEVLHDRNASEAVRGMLVGVPRTAMPAVGKDEYYWADLIGMQVVNAHDQVLGRVLGLIDTSANDVLRVGDKDGAERLLPFVASVVLDVDMNERRIRVRLGSRLVSTVDSQASLAGQLVADVVTLFPEMFVALTQSGITRRALEEKRWSLDFWNPRDFTQDAHRTVDDRPYGGGPGMVMMVEPLEAAISSARLGRQRAD